MVKAFLAHAKADDDGALRAARSALAAAFKTDSPELGVEIVLGRDDYNEHIAGLGSWTEWAVSVPVRYDVIVVNKRNVGKATMQMLDAAFRQKRPVLLFEGGRLVQVGGVQTLDSRNFQEGWRITAGGAR